VIYFRHAATEAGGVNGTETLGDRDAQRNLSREGREQSEAIGEAFEELDVPVGEVLSSPYFRNTDTAELAFGRAQPTEDLLGLLSVEGEDEERNRRFLRDQLPTPPGGAGNTVLVSHTSNLEEVAGVTLEEGEAAVYEPLGNGDFELRARLMPEEWRDLP
jgi:phosphohistidine phosphatase SixA